MGALEILEQYGYDGVIIFDDYDTALIGVTTDNRAVYSYALMLEHLVLNGMTEDEAVEWIDFNTIGSLGFEGCPIVMYDLN